MSVVYWLRLKSHTNILTEGYVGVTVDFDRRIKSHIRREKLPLEGDWVSEIVAFGNDDFCYKYEKQLRPGPNIGWNIAPGGKGGHRSSGYKLSNEFRTNRSKFMLGNIRATGNKNKPKSDDHRLKISAAVKGKPKSEEQKRKQSETMKAKHRAAMDI